MTNRVEIDEDGNGEHSDILVCMRLTKPLMFPDNLIDVCSKSARGGTPKGP